MLKKKMLVHRTVERGDFICTDSCGPWDRWSKYLAYNDPKSSVVACVDHGSELLEKDDCFQHNRKYDDWFHSIKEHLVLRWLSRSSCAMVDFLSLHHWFGTMKWLTSPRLYFRLFAATTCSNCYWLVIPVLVNPVCCYDSPMIPTRNRTFPRLESIS